MLCAKILLIWRDFKILQLDFSIVEEEINDEDAPGISMVYGLRKTV